MQKTYRKTKNPSAIDHWLDSIGFYRKNVAYDETCLFRAASEQLFQCQLYHETVRKNCVQFGMDNHKKFSHFLDEAEWFERLASLEKHMVVCGVIELELIRLRYQREIILFDGNSQTIVQGDLNLLDTEPKPIMLCRINTDHYDSVFRKEHIQLAGFCQSIVYGILYTHVYEIEDVPGIVNSMLYEKEQDFVSNERETNNNNNQEVGDISSAMDVPGNAGISAPFPYKVAKALDPNIYRNIEYDVWTEIRRSMRLGDWYNGDDKLILGTKCLVNWQDEQKECYIQEIRNDGKCIVYITKLAERREVEYADLSPEQDAKPWPLPYRLSKHQLAVSNSRETHWGQHAEARTGRPIPKAKRNPSIPNGENSNCLSIEAKDNGVPNCNSTHDSVDTPSVSPSSVHTTSNSDQQEVSNAVNSFVGAPLQMQGTYKKTKDSKRMFVRCHSNKDAPPKNERMFARTISATNTSHPHENTLCTMMDAAHINDAPFESENCNAASTNQYASVNAGNWDTAYENSWNPYIVPCTPTDPHFLPQWSTTANNQIPMSCSTPDAMPYNNVNNIQIMHNSPFVMNGMIPQSADFPHPPNSWINPVSAPSSPVVTCKPNCSGVVGSLGNTNDGCNASMHMPLEYIPEQPNLQVPPPVILTTLHNGNHGYINVASTSSSMGSINEGPTIITPTTKSFVAPLCLQATPLTPITDIFPQAHVLPSPYATSILYAAQNIPPITTNNTAHVLTPDYYRFMYPTPSPIAWYPPGVTPQGFIFPTT